MQKTGNKNKLHIFICRYCQSERTLFRFAQNKKTVQMRLRQMQLQFVFETLCLDEWIAGADARKRY